MNERDKRHFKAENREKKDKKRQDFTQQDTFMERLLEERVQERNSSFEGQLKSL